MRATWIIWALMLAGCGDGSNGAKADGDTSTDTTGGDGSSTTSSSGDGGTAGGGTDEATTGSSSTTTVTRSSATTTTSSTTGTGGGASSDGTGGMGGASPGIEGIGEPCTAASDCTTGLDCLDAGSDTFQVDTEGTLAGPPHGVCTASCTTQDDCDALDPNTLCLNVTETDAYCMPFCYPGDGNVDCNQRADMVCMLLATGDDGGACESSADCGANQVCAGGGCAGVIPACVPNCATDDDCPQGRYCDPAGGLCIDEPREGAEVGEACVDHEDCKSLACVEGICSRVCTLGVNEACGEVTDPLSDVCLPLYDVGIDAGDMGRCLSVCDCPDDCASGTCLSFQDAEFEDALGRPGFCGEFLDGDIEVTCDPS